ncbi:rhodanese-like domain-containing protein [Octadecabacter sp. R77987]|uniref:rhodanese-like domain-containing protein n=1 Tax=Octadecabacter sp. R77987 TaxID=3093874 RepID=UPI00366F5ABC
MLRYLTAIGLVFSVFTTNIAVAQDVRITPARAQTSFEINGQTFTIARNQDSANTLTGEFARTSRECPPFCITPMIVADGVTTMGELEVIRFLEQDAADGTGLLIDSRLPDWFVQGTIPGAVNVPFHTLEATNPYRDDILRALGAAKLADGTLDFTQARALLLFCNGAWCDQSPRAIRSLLDAGYPAGKLSYYRGGMQSWRSLGLTVATPRNEG